MGKPADVELYRPRIIDEKIDEYLKTFGAVCITGPKRCGKSWTASYHSKSEFFLKDSADDFNNKTLAELSPKVALEGEAPRLIDEWQDVPKIWDAVRFEVDRRGKKGQFILTSSSSPKNLRTMHYGTGRIARLRMRTMSLFETGDSDGSVSLEKLCDGQMREHLVESKSLDEIIRFVVRGGWPGNLGDVPNAMDAPSAYVEDVLSWNTVERDDVRYNKDNLRLLLEALARHESTTASLTAIQSDISSNSVKNSVIAFETIRNYLDYLSRKYVTENIPPFAVNLRSSKRVKQADKRHFCDVSLACALLGATPEKLRGDLKTLGFLFEALCEHDLRIYAESFGARIYHYQDYADHEIDAVLELRDGRWCAFEIKLGANQADEAARSLLKASAYIESHEGKAPSAMCVICGLCGAAYRLENGVFVVPITALKP